jgi:hypothetical protein
MRGNNINNVYIIDGKELNSKEITNEQLLFIETYENRKLYNDFRNRLLEENGDDVFYKIKIRIPEIIFYALDECSNEITL